MIKISTVRSMRLTAAKRKFIGDDLMLGLRKMKDDIVLPHNPKKQQILKTRAAKNFHVCSMAHT